jgi:hypothetical protein
MDITSSFISSILNKKTVGKRSSILMLNKVVWERVPGMELTDKYKNVNKLH